LVASSSRILAQIGDCFFLRKEKAIPQSTHLCKFAKVQIYKILK
jgi:hypothetical protein